MQRGRKFQVQGTSTPTKEDLARTADLFNGIMSCRRWRNSMSVCEREGRTYIVTFVLPVHSFREFGLKILHSQTEMLHCAPIRIVRTRPFGIVGNKSLRGRPSPQIPSASRILAAAFLGQFMRIHTSDVEISGRFRFNTSDVPPPAHRIPGISGALPSPGGCRRCALLWGC